MKSVERPSWRGYLFVAPATVYLAVFALLPLGVAGYLALHRWHLLKPEHPFVGGGNFTALWTDPFFRQAVSNTLLYVVLSVPLGVVTALGVAVLVAQPLRGMGLFRTLFYIPAVSSQVALSMVWIWILLPEVGLLNGCVKWLGGAGTTNFLGEPGWALLALVAMSLWIGLGPRMIIFLAGIQSIPGSLFEAAALDGCNAWRRFLHITLPLLAPTMLFVVVTTTIAAFQLFTPVYVMTRGGPRRSTDVLLYHIYQEAWQKLELGMASAQSYVLFAMILVVALVQFRLLRRGWTGVSMN
ncbi:MAG TPA: sugar ABC transporter permease [Phycisphaerae bacterium]|nr:sugar ABC transporter permease [Phycisphaerae bacterium]HNU45774.1 sugar ABC transporter permease [Phycisphaerae bacterium]